VTIDAAVVGRHTGNKISKLRDMAEAVKKTGEVSQTVLTTEEEIVEIEETATELLREEEAATEEPLSIQYEVNSDDLTQVEVEEEPKAADEEMKKEVDIMVKEVEPEVIAEEESATEEPAVIKVDFKPTYAAEEEEQNVEIEIEAETRTEIAPMQEETTSKVEDIEIAEVETRTDSPVEDEPIVIEQDGFRTLQVVTESEGLKEETTEAKSEMDIEVVAEQKSETTEEPEQQTDSPISDVQLSADEAFDISSNIIEDEEQVVADKEIRYAEKASEQEESVTIVEETAEDEQETTETSLNALDDTPIDRMDTGATIFADATDSPVEERAEEVTDATTEEVVELATVESEEAKPSSLKAVIKMNITISSRCNDTSNVVHLNETMTLDELLQELNVTTDEIETTFEEIGTAMESAIDTTVEAFGSLFSGMLDVMTSPTTDLRPMVSINTGGAEDGSFTIPGVFSVNTNRKDGALLAIEDGEKTKVRIPGLLHMQVGGKDNKPDNSHLFRITADDKGARIQAPFIDIEMPDFKKKVKDHDVILS